MIQKQAAPEVELECFDGNSLEYNHFVDLFREEVEKWIPELKGRLLRLLKYTTGEAHDLIKHCARIIITTWVTVMLNSFLERDMEDPSYSQHTGKKVRNWPKLKFGDAKGCRKSYNFLVKFEGVL